MKLSIIIPVFNEEKTIEKVLDKIDTVQLIGGVEKEVVIVNDGSTDRTHDAVTQFMNNSGSLSIKYFRCDKNSGKGAAVRKGLEHVSGDFVIIQDADLEYAPEEYNILLKPILDGFADVVYGSRFIGGRPHRILFFWHSIGNKFLTGVSNFLTDLNLTDMETCYKVFRSDIIKSLSLNENGFGFEPEVTAKISRIPAVRIYEVGISYFGRTYKEGKKVNWKDGVKALIVIFKYNLLSTK